MPKAARKIYSLKKGMASSDGYVYDSPGPGGVDLVGWWKLDENVVITSTSTVSKDSSGNGHDGTYQSPDGGTAEGTPRFVEGPNKINRHALRTAGPIINDDLGGVYLPTAGNLGIDGTKPFSVQCFVRPDRAQGGSSGVFFSISVTSSDDKRIILYIGNTSHKIKFTRYDGTVDQATIHVAYCK